MSALERFAAYAAAFEPEETAHFSGDRIRRLEDAYEPAEKDELDAYVKAHGARIGLAVREA